MAEEKNFFTFGLSRGQNFLLITFTIFSASFRLDLSKDFASSRLSYLEEGDRVAVMLWHLCETKNLVRE